MKPVSFSLMEMQNPHECLLSLIWLLLACLSVLWCSKSCFTSWPWILVFQESFWSTKSKIQVYCVSAQKFWQSQSKNWHGYQASESTYQSNPVKVCASPHITAECSGFGLRSVFPWSSWTAQVMESAIWGRAHKQDNGGCWHTLKRSYTCKHVRTSPLEHEQKYVSGSANLAKGRCVTLRKAVTLTS